MEFINELKQTYERGDLTQTINLYQELLNQGKIDTLTQENQLTCLYYAIASIRFLQKFSIDEYPFLVSNIPSFLSVENDEICSVVWLLIQWLLTNFIEEIKDKIYDKLEYIEKLANSFSEEKQINHAEWISYLYLILGSMYFPVGLNYPSLLQLDLKKALEYYNKSLNLQEKANFHYGKTHTLTLIGNLYSMEGDFNTALDYSRRSLEIAQKYNFKERRMVAVGNIGYFNFELGNLDEALKFIKKAEDLNSSIGRITHIPVYLGIMHAQKLEFPEAFSYITKALDEFRQSNFEYGVVNSLKALGDLYYQIGDITEANHYYQQILTFKPENTYECRYEVLYRLIEISLDNKKIDLALKFKKDMFEYYTSKENKNVEFYKQMTEALINKSSSRIRKRVKAQDFFETFLKSPIDNYFFKALVISNLCEMLLEEFLLYADNDVLTELSKLVDELYELGLNNVHSALLLSGLILKAKLKLVEANYDEVKKIFESAIKFTDAKNLPKLKEKIILEIEEISKFKVELDSSLKNKIKDAQVKMYISEAQKIMELKIK